MEDFVTVNNLIKYAVVDVNNVFTEQNAFCRLSIESYRKIKIVPTQDKYIKYLYDLTSAGKDVVIQCFRRYGLMPIFYTDSIGVEIDND